jgi:imidazolonepropionase-like amidohydrolase
MPRRRWSPPAGWSSGSGWGDLTRRFVLGSLLLLGSGARAESWTLVGVRIIPSSEDTVVEDGVVVVDGERIAAVGPRGSVPIPASARRIESSGATLVPGYWNVHVHLTDPRWGNAAAKSAEALTQACRDMLGSRGFTTVVDLGSDPANTRVLRARAGAVGCPRSRFIDAGAAQLRAFAAGGGQVLFGTDVGYIGESDADEEVGRMAAAGMNWRAILTSLSTAPAHRFRDAERGTVRAGQRADLVLLDGDPRRDVRALAQVKSTWVAGRPIFEQAKR